MSGIRKWQRDMALYAASLYGFSAALYLAGWHPLAGAVWAPLIGLGSSIAAELYLSEPEMTVDV